MEGTEYEFDVKDRVKLKDIDPVFYGGMACVGNEAVITNRRKDKWGLPEIQISWDKDHWAYNDAPDGWTLQEHFELVKKGEVMSEDDKKRRGLDNLFKRSSKVEQESKPEVSEKSFDAAISEAVELLGECEGFVVIGVQRIDDPRAPKGMLAPVAVASSKNPESELVVASAANQYASQAHTELALHAIESLTKRV